jgi:hypothetical protein
VGFPRGARGTDKLAGQTIPGNKTDDGKPQIFVTPIASTGSEALQVLIVQIMQALTFESGSGLTALCLQLGIMPTGNRQNPWRVEGTQVLAAFGKVHSTLGEYPHSAVKKAYEAQRDSAMVKAYCETTDYKVRIAQSWITKHGAPYCGCCNKRMAIDSK